MNESTDNIETPAAVEHPLRRLTVVPGGRPNINETAEAAARHALAKGLPIRFRVQPTILFADDRYYGWSGVIWTFEVKDLDQLLQFKDDMSEFAVRWAHQVEITAPDPPVGEATDVVVHPEPEIEG